MMMKIKAYLVALMSAMILTAPSQMAHAQTGSTKTCDGKYMQAAISYRSAISKYGTIYSGGLHFSRTDNVGYTLNFYRTLKGLSDNHTRNFNRHAGFGSYAFKAQNLDAIEAQIQSALTVMTDASISQIIDLSSAAKMMDIVTTSHPTLDWWLRPQDFKTRKTIYERYDWNRSGVNFDQNHISELHFLIASLSKTHPELDWLQSALVISKVTYPWAIKSGDKPSPEMARVLAHISDQVLTAKDPLPWIALLELNLAYDYAIPTEVLDIIDDIKTRLQSCEASPAEYAALLANKTYIAEDRVVSGFQADQYLHHMKSYLMASQNPADEALYKKSIEMSEALNVSPALFGPSLLSVSTPEQLAKVMHKSNAKYDILSRLKTDYLGPYNTGSAFTRYLSLGEYAKARSLMDVELADNPAIKDELDDILSAGLSDQLALSMIALRQKCLSHKLSNFCVMETYNNNHQHRNLGGVMTVEGFLADSMYCYGQAKTRYRGHSGPTAAAADRNARRGRGANPDARLRFHQFSHYWQGCSVRGTSQALSDHPTSKDAAPIKALFDEDELELLLGEKRLTRTLSLAVIEAAAQRPKPRRFFSPKRTIEDDLLAEALHRVVWMNKHESSGSVDGIPVGKRAFKLLHQLYPETIWAEKTKYWWL